jgi:hypothetical protein
MVATSSFELIDEEVRRIVDDAHDEVTQLLSGHREQLDNLTPRYSKAKLSTHPARTPPQASPSVHPSELVAASAEPRPA